MKAFANAASAALVSTSTPSAAASPPFPFPAESGRTPGLASRSRAPSEEAAMGLQWRYASATKSSASRSVSRAATLSTPPGT